VQSGARGEVAAREEDDDEIGSRDGGLDGRGLREVVQIEEDEGLARRRDDETTTAGSGEARCVGHRGAEEQGRTG